MGHARRRSNCGQHGTRLVVVIMGSLLWLASTSRVIYGLSITFTTTRSTLRQPMGRGLALEDLNMQHAFMATSTSNQVSIRSEWQLSAKQKKGDSKNEEEEESEGAVQKYLEELKEKLMEVLPPRVSEVVLLVLEKAKTWISMATVGAVSFVVGGILSALLL
eukprot:scaffold55747_cov30-Attheya_sp.AAC.1